MQMQDSHLGHSLKVNSKTVIVNIVLRSFSLIPTRPNNGMFTLLPLRSDAYLTT
jgi:hypothetical protein